MADRELDVRWTFEGFEGDGIPTPAQVGLARKPRSERLRDARRSLARQIRELVTKNPEAAARGFSIGTEESSDLIDLLLAEMRQAGWDANPGPDGSFWLKPREIPEGPVKRSPFKPEPKPSPSEPKPPSVQPSLRISLATDFRPINVVLDDQVAARYDRYRGPSLTFLLDKALPKEAMASVHAWAKSRRLRIEEKPHDLGHAWVVTSRCDDGSRGAVLSEVAGLIASTARHPDPAKVYRAIRLLSDAGIQAESDYGYWVKSHHTDEENAERALLKKGDSKPFQVMPKAESEPEGPVCCG